MRLEKYLNMHYTVDIQRKMKFLDCSGIGITDLSGIENLNKLVFLSFQDNPISYSYKSSNIKDILTEVKFDKWMNILQSLNI